MGTSRQTADLATVGRLANRFRVSRRAAALRLIEADRATWGLYRSIPPYADQLRSGGGGPGRNRAEISAPEIWPTDNHVVS